MLVEARFGGLCAVFLLAEAGERDNAPSLDDTRFLSGVACSACRSAFSTLRASLSCKRGKEARSPGAKRSAHLLVLFD
jgi:hypothetical protein